MLTRQLWRNAVTSWVPGSSWRVLRSPQRHLHSHLPPRLPCWPRHQRARPPPVTPPHWMPLLPQHHHPDPMAVSTMGLSPLCPPLPPLRHGNHYPPPPQLKGHLHCISTSLINLASIIKVCTNRVPPPSTNVPRAIIVRLINPAANTDTPLASPLLTHHPPRVRNPRLINTLIPVLIVIIIKSIIIIAIKASQVNPAVSIETSLGPNSHRSQWLRLPMAIVWM